MRSQKFTASSVGTMLLIVRDSDSFWAEYSISDTPNGKLPLMGDSVKFARQFLASIRAKKVTVKS
jgi:hypothetical protein